MSSLAEYYRSPQEQARRAKASGQQVVGFIGDGMPVELVRAAGMRPLRLKGRPAVQARLAPRYHVPRFTARDGLAESILECLLCGELAFLDHLVVVHDRDAFHRLYQLLSSLRQGPLFAELPPVVLLDLLHTTTFATSRYEYKQLLQLRQRLEQWSGRPLTDSALHAAIVDSNRNRALVAELNDLRRQGRVSGSQALQIMGAAFAMPPAAYQTEVRALMDEAKGNDTQPGHPTFVAGSPWDHTGLYQVLEAAGLRVVGEASDWGLTAFSTPIPTDGDPFAALCDHYHRRPPSSRMFPMARNIEHARREAVACGADAAVVAVRHNDHAEAWEVPEKLKALRGAGLPTLHLPDLPYAVESSEGLLEQVEQFSQSLRDSPHRTAGS